MSTIKANTLTVKCGSTLTLGESGKTVTIASGASTSGMGRTGTVDWQTTVKTTGFTAVSGEGYFCDTSSGAFTLTLPSSPSVGDIVAFKDYATSFAAENLTIGRGGSNLNGSPADSVRDIDNESLTLVYADSTKGWLAVEEGTGFLGQTFIAASGGTESTCGNFKIHTFTGPGTFSVSSIATGGTCAPNTLEYVVVAGGGGGGGLQGGGGGGAGGFRFASPTLAPITYPVKPLAAPAGLNATVSSFPITIGSGGTGVCNNTARGGSGTNSTFSTITAAGGGGGGLGQCGQPIQVGIAGGSGGGGGGRNPPGAAIGGAGNTPPTSPSQGNNGGAAKPGPSSPSNDRGGGGGGATAVGTIGGNDPGCAGAGGAGGGLPTAFGANGVPCGSFRYYAGGGGGGKDSGSPSANPAGGLGGGGPGSAGPAKGTAGTVNTGGGGGGSGTPCSAGGGNGGSGVVIIRYKYQ